MDCSTQTIEKTDLDDSQSTTPVSKIHSSEEETSPKELPSIILPKIKIVVKKKVRMKKVKNLKIFIS